MPRNMQSTYKEARRRARGEALLASVRLDKDRACFVDAASYTQEEAFCSVFVDCDSKVISCAVIRSSSSNVAEHVAIDLALTDGVRDTIYSDCKAAIQAFKMGVVAPQFPEHLGTIEGFSLNPNEEAHSAALVTRHILGDPSLSARTTRYASTTISQEECRLYHTPLYAGPKLSLSDDYKQALTRALRHYTQCTLNHSPSPDCALCGGYADFEHVPWGCASAGPPFTHEEMKKLIKGQDQTSQILVVQRASARAVRFNRTVPE
ncbi:hypothetical protein HPB52_017793 [Rhipicephalus sanguineus]|uniref:Tick transposon n=1 Tax=Rhipicephalus sanguineus TaxID=34632 RepID=A0A9D4SUN3_RHISA|nr:hypothetical protein HPB52_017793 [Rhipicephalus sanguineus]